MVRICRVVTVALAFLLAQGAYAKKGALIDYDDGKASPQLAKSWKKVKDGVYEFELDTSKSVQGKSLEPGMVKTTLEKKLSKKYGVSVTPKGASAVSVTYTTDEDQFLEKVSKTKIRSNDVELAMQGNVSDGGLRADQKVRAAKAGEVIGTIVALKGSVAKVKINSSKSNKIKGGVVSVDLGDTEAAKSNRIIFKPGKKNKKGVWQFDGEVEVYGAN